MSRFVKTLPEKGRLLNQEEVQAIPGYSEKYSNQGEQIHRIQGRDVIEKIAKKSDVMIVVKLLKNHCNQRGCRCH